VLLTFAKYRRLIDERTNILELLATPDAAGIAFDPPRLNSKFHQAADLT
jgi:hypothetical protein